MSDKIINNNGFLRILSSIILISIALYFVYTGGQIAVIIADFFQGVFLIVVLFVITIHISCVKNEQI